MGIVAGGTVQASIAIAPASALFQTVRLEAHSYDLVCEQCRVGPRTAATEFRTVPSCLARVNVALALVRAPGSVEPGAFFLGEASMSDAHVTARLRTSVSNRVRQSATCASTFLRCGNPSLKCCDADATVLKPCAGRGDRGQTDV